MDIHIRNAGATYTFAELLAVVKTQGELICYGDYACLCSGENGACIAMVFIEKMPEIYSSLDIVSIPIDVRNFLDEYINNKDNISEPYTIYGLDEPIKVNYLAVTPIEKVIDKNAIGSNVIAELTGKLHAHVRQDIKRVTAALGIDPTQYESTYQSNRRGLQPCYLLPTHLAKTIVTGYDPVLRHKVILKLEALEERVKQPLKLTTDQLLLECTTRIEELSETVVNQAVHTKTLTKWVGTCGKLKRAKATLVEKGLLTIDGSDIRLTKLGVEAGIGVNAFGDGAKAMRLLFTKSVLDYIK